jgi:NADPH2:quinone reductase
MRAVICRTYGPPAQLVVEEWPTPACGPGEVRIKVHAAGVNFPDTLIIEGKYQLKPDPPFVPGGEVAGVVEAVGSAVTDVHIGDRVVALTGWGGFAEAVVVTPNRLTALPAGMDFRTAASFAMTYGTSMHALRQRAQLQPGESLLVLGAGGGVGLAAVELGRLFGARVIAAASSADKLKAAQSAGAQELINYASEPLRERLKVLTQGKGVDVVYDPVGGDLFEQALRSLAWKGRLLVVGFASGRIPQAAANLMLLKGSAVVGVFWGGFRQNEPEENRRNFEQLFNWYADGRLHPNIERVLPLKDAPLALEALRTRAVTGKIVLSLADPDERREQH